MSFKLKPNQYYGYMTYDDDTYHVVCIKPAACPSPKDWIGQRDVKFSDLLCIDDYIIANSSIKVDWSKCNER